MMAILFKSCLISLLVSPGLLALPVFQPEKPIRTCDGEEFPDLNKHYEPVGGISLGHFHPPEDTSCSRLHNPSYRIEGGSGIRISPQEATPGGHNPLRSRKHAAGYQQATRKSKCLKYTQDGAPESTRAQQFGTQEGGPKASKNSDVDLITTQCVTDVFQAGILGSPEKGNHQERPPHLDVYNWNLVEIQGSGENDKHREEISRKLGLFFEELEFHHSDKFHWIPATSEELPKVLIRFNKSKYRFHVECGSQSTSRSQKLKDIAQYLSDEKLALDEYPTFSKDIMGQLKSSLESRKEKLKHTSLLPARSIEFILQGVSSLTKIATFLIIFRLSLFKEHIGPVLQKEVVKNILVSIKEFWRKIETQETAGMPDVPWAKKMNRVFFLDLPKTGQKSKRSNYIRYSTAWKIVEYWENEHGKFRVKGKPSEKLNEICNTIILYSNPHFVLQPPLSH
ncbi:hypothetical protein MJO29_016211 [Puccinia striiformis f. sp. tritici]|nr:hypothetical protein MJO29_016211 [Puccinia striiformis f. sp. tritici]